MLRVLLPNGGHVAIVSGSQSLSAYFDESVEDLRRPRVGMLSVAGYLFEAQPYLDFDSGMDHVLRDYNLKYFRMSECTSETNQFAQHKGTGVPDEAERRVIQLTRDHAILGVAGAVPQERFNLMQPLHSEVRMGGPYTYLCQWCLDEIGKWANRNNFHGDIAYNFESGFVDQREANQVMNTIPMLSPKVKEHYRYASHSFADKVRLRGLQAADMLAWFYRRESEDEEKIAKGEQVRDRRLDFSALVGETLQARELIEHRFRHFDYDTLQGMFSENSDPSMWLWGSGSVTQ